MYTVLNLIENLSLSFPSLSLYDETSVVGLDAPNESLPSPHLVPQRVSFPLPNRAASIHTRLAKTERRQKKTSCTKYKIFIFQRFLKAFIDPKPSLSTSKTMIQEKLENWNPRTMTMEEFQEKLTKAEKRREHILSDVTLRASNHLNHVRKSVEEINALNQEKTMMIEHKLKEKVSRSAETKECIHQAIESKVSSKMEKIATLKESKEKELKALERNVQAKLMNALQRKEQILAEEKEKTVEANKKKSLKIEMIQEEASAKVEQLDSLQQKRIEEAIERREHALHSKVKQLTMSNKKKIERAQLLGHLKESECERLKENLFERLDAVAARKDEVVKEKAFKAAITNSKVLEKVEEVKASQKSEILEKEYKTLNKLEAASKRKGQLHDVTDLEQRNAAKLEKAKQIVELRDAKIEELQQTLKEKIAMVSEKKEMNVSATKRRASLKNEYVAKKAAEIQKIRDEELKILDASLSEKLHEGFRRSQEYLSKRSEKSGNRARTGSKSSSSFDTPALIEKVSSDSTVSFDCAEDLNEDIVENKVQFFEYFQGFSLLIWNMVVSFFKGFNVKV